MENVGGFLKTVLKENKNRSDGVVRNEVTSWKNVLSVLSGLSDKELYGLCRECGNNAREWLRKFAVLLMEVSRRGLHRRRGYSSIYEFAAKMVGMNKYTVNRILCLDRLLMDKPVLRLLIGEVGWSKIYVVASVATAETDKFWADKVRLLPKGALEVYVKDLREQEKRVIDSVCNGMGEMVDGKLVVDSGTMDGVVKVKLVGGGGLAIRTVTGQPLQQSIGQFFVGSASENHVPGDAKFQNSVDETWQMFSFKLSGSVVFKLRLLKQKIEKEKSQTLTFNEVFEEVLGRVGMD